MTDSRLEKGLTNAVNKHGYAFQYAAIKEAERAFNEDGSPWTIVISEFPVSSKGGTTHVDFVLLHKERPLYLVVECKRVDPAKSIWCFLKAPYTDPLTDSLDGVERIVRETLFAEEKGIFGQRFALEWLTLKIVYRLGFELKSGKKGDGKFRDKEIREATAQVLRGMNGIVQFVHDQYEYGNRSQFRRVDANVTDDGRLQASFMPVIFTTAELYAADVDLSEADLLTGKLKSGKLEIEEKNWLFYQYAQSPDLKHALSISSKQDSMADIQYNDYTRTIPIVSAKGISDFLCSELWRGGIDWKEEL